MRIFSNKNRPVHLGSLPLERLARTNNTPDLGRIAPLSGTGLGNATKAESLSPSILTSIEHLDLLREGDEPFAKASIPDDPIARAQHLKSACYYLDASLVGTCRIPTEARLREAGAVANDYAVVILFEFVRESDPDEPGGHWLSGTQPERAAVRVAEIAAVITHYLGFLGYVGRMHTVTASDLNLNTMIVAAGLGEADPASGAVTAAFLGPSYGVAVVTTDLKIAADRCLASGALKRRTLANWIGWGGTRPGFQGRPFEKRSFHLGLYPMEKIKTVSHPTTLIDAPNIPRIPKRHDMFTRAEAGDLGEKTQKAVTNERFITKSPFGHALLPVLGHGVPLQQGETAAKVVPGYEDPAKNSAAVKAALYYLGADMVGICEIPEYAWYSHDLDGSEIVPYHKYAISILIDQGYETMEGASGDDWISGAQSMRAYMRAQLISNIVGEHLRRLGHTARGHSVIDQDVLHIPLILLSGLGEMSRIGELVLNPFVGPRFKSGVITTNMPLEPDRPIDFGLQDFCSKCQKCARECPVSAIPFGDKIMFNGYEMWKPDVEKCARYRITNAAGSVCGRCMKTCPYNLEGVLSERPFLWAARHLPFTRRWIASLDDMVGNGRINPVKKWWWDLDYDESGYYRSARRTNERQLNFRAPLSPDTQKLACYPADTVPSPGAGPTLPNRKAGILRYRNAMRPQDYKPQR